MTPRTRDRLEDVLALVIILACAWGLLRPYVGAQTLDPGDAVQDGAGR